MSIPDQPKMSHSIVLENASFSYRKGIQVFTNVSFSLSAGDILTILGANGAGKSTLLNCIANVYSLNGGCILVNGEDINYLPPERLALSLAYVPQIQRTVFDYSVLDYVVMGRAPHISLMRNPTPFDYEIAENILAQMKLSHLRDVSFQQISGGERQQTQIARALAQGSKIILMDEPTNHLDYGNQLKVLSTIQELSRQGYILILTTHIPDHAILLNGIVGIMRQGSDFLIGSVDDIITEQNLSSIYNMNLRIVYVEELGRKACFAASIC